MAEHADICHGFGDAETIAHTHAVLDGWCRRLGRDPRDIERSAGVAPTPGRLPEDVADHVASAGSLYAVGTRLFTVGLAVRTLTPARSAISSPGAMRATMRLVSSVVPREAAHRQS